MSATNFAGFIPQFSRLIIPMMRPVFITTLVIIVSGIVKLYDLIVKGGGKLVREGYHFFVELPPAAGMEGGGIGSILSIVGMCRRERGAGFVLAFFAIVFFITVVPK